ncbi:probable UDP-sugar transporter protein SLC35A5 isoform X2 [Acanthaster planci]|nr:probable UDP-sugar transporter protein SLC35A5 isoform X2 [Acanthaster planci]
MAGSWESLITVALATIFITLAGFRVLLIKLSANQDGGFDYLPVAVNLCAEIIKLLVCSILSLNVITKERLKSCSVFAFSIYDVLRLFKWSVPGLLYFLDNLIAFYVVASFEPAIVVLLNNFVIISTALLFRLVLKRKLSRVQWASLIILFLTIVSLSQHSHEAANYKPHGMTKLNKSSQTKLPSLHQGRCIADVSQIDKCNNLETCTTKLNKWHLLQHLESISVIGKYQGYVWVILQCFISSLANIYNEKIFKEGKGFEDSIYVQNSKLYFFGVLVNFMSILCFNKFWEHTVKCGLFHGFNIFSYLLILDSAFMGLTISLILKFRDNMFHVLSAQLVTVLVIAVSILFMGFQPPIDFFLQAPTVLLSIYVFNISKGQSESPNHRNRTQSTSEPVNVC